MLIIQGAQIMPLSTFHFTKQKLHELYSTVPRMKWIQISHCIILCGVQSPAGGYEI